MTCTWSYVIHVYFSILPIWNICEIIEHHHPSNNRHDQIWTIQSLSIRHLWYIYHQWCLESVNTEVFGFTGWDLCTWPAYCTRDSCHVRMQWHGPTRQTSLGNSWEVFERIAPRMTWSVAFPKLSRFYVNGDTSRKLFTKQYFHLH